MQTPFLGGAILDARTRKHIGIPESVLVNPCTRSSDTANDRNFHRSVVDNIIVCLQCLPPSFPIVRESYLSTYNIFHSCANTHVHHVCPCVSVRGWHAIFLARLRHFKRTVVPEPPLKWFDNFLERSRREHSRRIVTSRRGFHSGNRYRDEIHLPVTSIAIIIIQLVTCSVVYQAIFLSSRQTRKKLVRRM